MILRHRSRDPGWALLHCLRSLVGERVAVVLPTVGLLLALGHGAPARAHSAEGAETGATPVAQLSTAPQGTEMFEHAPVPAADRGRARAGTVVGSVKLRADLRRARQVLLNVPNAPPTLLEAETVKERSGQDYSFRGRGEDADAELVVTDQGITGTVRVGSVGYGLQPLGDGWSILVRLDKEPKHYPNKPEAPKQPIKPKADAASADSGAKVNVLVVYTPAAASWVGDIAAIIQLAEDKTNAALSNSQVPSSIDIVYSAQVAYAEAADMLDDLRRLTNVNDGFMDEVHALRDAYKADLVALLVDPGNWGGIAWINSTADYGFSVTAADAVYYNTFQHELGHNWWMRHNPEEDGSSSPIPYAHGYCYTPGNWRTVMSYDMGCYGRINKYPE
jgi:hypothetical protein